jgi:hypothetical protein
MRLTPQQIDIIKDTATEVFGDGVQLRVFGSRADDLQRGGDIDLFVSGVSMPLDVQIDAKLHFLVKAKQRLGDQRIDLVFAPPAGQSALPIQRIAQQTGILL